MTRPVYFWWMYGMWGPITDPGSRAFDARVKQRFPQIDIRRSPYRDYDINAIVAEIIGIGLKNKPIIIVGGVSLGCNNTPLVSAYLRHAGYAGLVHRMLGFQASNYGEHAGAVPYYQGIYDNTIDARLFSSDTIFPVPGIGAYEWVKAPGNNKTNLVITPTHLIHPGDGDVASQNHYLDLIEQTIENPGDNQ